MNFRKPCRPDKITEARKKNDRVQRRLQLDLAALTREAEFHVKMKTCELQQFKNKSGEMRSDLRDDARGREPSDLVNFDTHCPGFCYRRNGECRVHPVSIIKNVNMQDLHILLFSRGEIDADKVVCLYLLTAHLCETLQSPPKSQEASFLTKHRSPLERLVDRSKRMFRQNKLIPLMPLYTLDASPEEAFPKTVLRDRRLMGKAIVNLQILGLVHSVLQALKTSNPRKYHKIVDMACDIPKMLAMMNKPKMVKFYSALYSQNLISTCESFQLEIIHSPIVLIPVYNIHLSDLLKAIRSKVLLVPKSNTWTPKRYPFAFLEQYSEFEEEMEECRNIGKKVELIKEYNRVEEEPESSKRKPGPSTETECTLTEIINRMSALNEKHHQRPIDADDSFVDSEDSQYKMERNIDDVETFHGLSLLFTEKVWNVEYMEDRAYSIDSLASLRDADSECELYSRTTPKEHMRNPLKCEACVHGWTTSSPKPRVCSIAKNILPREPNPLYISTPSADYILRVINERLNCNDPKCRLGGIRIYPNRVLYKMVKGKMLENETIEIVTVAPLELARIRHEIKVLEVKKNFEDTLSKLDNLLAPRK